MRFSITLKLLLIYLLTAGGFLLVTLYSIDRFQGVSDQVYQLAGRDLEQVLQLREVRAALQHFDRLQRSLPLAPDGVSLETLRQSWRELDRSLRRYVRTAPQQAEQLDQLYQELLGGIADEVRPAWDGSLYGHLSNQVDTLLDLAEGRLREDQRLIADVTSGAGARLLLIYFGIFCGGLVLVGGVSLRILAGLREFRGRVAAIARGEYEVRLPADTGDELGEVARELNHMADRLEAARQLFLDASPLTYLPGNIAIERALMERLRAGEIFALCYLDLDDFKPFNDHYGYAKGSEVIKATAEIIHQVARSLGGARDFVGHIGGDDFVLITDMERVPALCSAIIADFDRMMPQHYSDEDRQRGHIEAHDRFGQTRQFPLMTISIAVVTNANREVSSPVEIARIAAEIKEYVKLLPGSNYLIDRRAQLR